jgi:hypothetical protein
MEALADFIFGLHVLLFLFVIGAPFFASPDWILIDLMLMVSVYFHWILRDNTCALTVLEKVIRGTPDDKETFFGRLFGEAYTFGRDSKISWAVIMVLIIVATYRSHAEIGILLNMMANSMHQIKWKLSKA